MAEPVISMRDVSHAFGLVTALDHFSLEVAGGALTLLLGPNGAGKTTAMRVITGVITPTAGAVQVFGQSPSGPSGDGIRQRCGVVPARPALYDRLSGADNLRYAAALYGVPDPEGTIETAARTFRIDHALAQRAGTYSTGMRARLALARAVLHEPELLLLDEPTAGLDPESAREVLQLIDDMAARGVAVLMSTHLLLEAEPHADRIVVMDRGVALVSADPSDLAARYAPSALVLVEAENAEQLDRAADLPFVEGYERNGAASFRLEHPDAVADLVAALVRDGVRVLRVEPQTPSLEELYVTVRREMGVANGGAPDG